jgi:hypothetical protein
LLTYVPAAEHLTVHSAAYPVLSVPDNQPVEFDLDLRVLFDPGSMYQKREWAKKWCKIVPDKGRPRPESTLKSLMRLVSRWEGLLPRRLRQ